MKYVTDITYVPIRGAMAYLSVIMDLYNREIVAHKISTLGDASEVLGIDAEGTSQSNPQLGKKCWVSRFRSDDRAVDRLW